MTAMTSRSDKGDGMADKMNINGKDFSEDAIGMAEVAIEDYIYKQTELFRSGESPLMSDITEYVNDMKTMIDMLDTMRGFNNG